MKKLIFFLALLLATTQIQAQNAALFKYDIVALTHSQEDQSASTGVDPFRMILGGVWNVGTGKVPEPPGLCNMLNRQGAFTKPRYFGIGGQTTAQIIGRADVIFQYSTPKVVVLDATQNDALVTETGTSPATGATKTIYTKSSGNGGLTPLNTWVGDVITITGGTGSGQTNTIVAYNYDNTNNRGVATVLNAWTTIPDNTSTYSIATPTQAQTQANLQALIKISKFKVVGYGAGLGLGVTLYNQSQLPANGFEGERFVIMSDNSTTGGISAYTNQPGQHTTITGDYSASPQQSVWEFRNPQSGETGWGRVGINTTAPFSSGCQYTMVMTPGYQNYTTGGDNANVASIGAPATGSPYSLFVPLRAACVAAVAAENGAILVDTYYFWIKLRDGGTFLGNTIQVEDTQGSAKTLVGPTNQHKNLLGHANDARCLYYTVMNTPGMFAALSQ